MSRYHYDSWPHRPIRNCRGTLTYKMRCSKKFCGIPSSLLLISAYECFKNYRRLPIPREAEWLDVAKQEINSWQPHNHVFNNNAHITPNNLVLDLQGKMIASNAMIEFNFLCVTSQFFEVIWIYALKDWIFTSKSRVVE